MIKFTQGNIFDSKAQTLVNTVNCVGVMGKGLAKEFRDRWPDMFNAYQAACKKGEVRSGKPFLYKDLYKIILNVPTKDNWKEPSKYEFVEAGLKAIRDHFQEWGIKSIALPPLGCGLGGLDWAQVKALMVKYLDELPIDVEVYEPAGVKDLKVSGPSRKRTILRVKFTLPLALTGELIRRARQAMPEQSALGKLLVQKLAFFAQLAGAPLRLKFGQYKFGPYDYNLHHMIERLEGLYIRDESPSWAKSNLKMLDIDDWLEAIQPMLADIEPYSKYLQTAVDLLNGRSLVDVELLATVQYAWCSLIASGLEGTEAEVIDFVHQWSKEKQAKFPADRVREALGILLKAGWLGPLGPGHPSPLIDPVPIEGEAVLS